MSYSLMRGRYLARLAGSAEDLAAVQALRGLCFRGAGAVDADAYDAICQHVMIEESGSGQLVCCLRLLQLASGAQIGRSYSAQFYGLDPLRAYPAPMVEMGRFCIHPEHHDADILRVAWGAVTHFVDEAQVGMLFGCSSFKGTDWRAHADSLAHLAQGYLAPARWLPQVKAGAVVPYARALSGVAGDRKQALLRMPALLRSYLAMGGWVSDHAVIDPDLGTLHVFTGLEIAAIPAARARALRAVAG
ncbi:GNAT family N-acetyltransferase [Thioclava kandeliae]|uniref:L-ornithine N(alpha)-acyltransferase n=1 Tax=Thioclava kandeliae TaxID=3070818 RepID=A0ABV1SC22_9RHOB